MMLEQITRQHDEVRELCRKYCVRRLELFGSALTEHFDSARSDFDFLVEFEPESPMGPFHQYIDFKIALEELFDRRVDLVELSAIRNPFFRKSVDRGPRTLLYAA
jgi:predicted nucleotidyltransferase